MFVYRSDDAATFARGGARQVTGGGPGRSEGPGVPDEEMSGQEQTDGRAQTCLHHAGRTTHLSAVSQELLRALYPLVANV